MSHRSRDCPQHRAERAPLENVDSGFPNWDETDRNAERLIGSIKAKIRVALKALRELPLRTPHSRIQGEQEKS